MAAPKSDATRKLGDALKRARGQLSQQDVADAAFIHVSNYGEYERGEREIGLHMLVRLAHVLGTTSAALLDGVDANDVGGVDSLEGADEVAAARKAKRESLRRAQRATR